MDSRDSSNGAYSDVPGRSNDDGVGREAGLRHSDASGREPRAEEIIVEVYRLIREARAASREPGRVVMDRDSYDKLQAYRARLGDAPEGKVDYLERYSIFGLEIFVEAGAPLSVR